MSDKTELKRVAQALVSGPSTDGTVTAALIDEFDVLASPDSVLALIAEIEALRNALCGVMEQVEGNIRQTVRDCVNGMDDVQDIYEYCNSIEAIIDLALSKGEQP